VIRSFRSPDTERLFHDRDVARLRGIERSARRKLLILHRAHSLQDLRVPPGNRLEELKGRRQGNTASGSTTSGGSASPGGEDMPLRLRSPIITEETKMAAKQLDPIHPGEILEEEFMRPLGLSANALARRIDVPVTRISEIVRGKRGITADTALRLSRLFGTSSGLWLGLQSEYDLRVARRDLSREDLIRITPLKKPAEYGEDNSSRTYRVGEQVETYGGTKASQRARDRRRIRRSPSSRGT
jgi:addiction module HigA family antidote